MSASEHSLRVLQLYRSYLQHSRHWLVDRAAWRKEAVAIRAKFDANKHVYDRALATKLLEEGEVCYIFKRGKKNEGKSFRLILFSSINS